MMCLDMDFLVFIVFGVHQASETCIFVGLFPKFKSSSTFSALPSSFSPSGTLVT